MSVKGVEVRILSVAPTKRRIVKTQPTSSAPPDDNDNGIKRDNKRTDQIVAIVANKESAERIRHAIVQRFKGTWVFVMKKGEKYVISVSNGWDGRLDEESLVRITSEIVQYTDP